MIKPDKKYVISIDPSYEDDEQDLYVKYYWGSSRIPPMTEEEIEYAAKQTMIVAQKISEIK